MKYCKENIFNYWSCCPSINLSNYVTEEELEEKISGITGGCDCDAITRQIEALQGAIVSLGDRITILENKMSQKADSSAITEIWDALSECCSGSPVPPEPEPPTPDTGDTPTGKAIMYFNDDTSRELNSTGASDTFINLVDTFPDFTGQTALTKVVLGNICYGIGYEAFANCTNLTAATLNDGLVSIGVDSFKGCSSLRTLVIPSTVEHITDTFIADCNLDSITYLSSTPPDVNNNNYQGANASANIIYVPATNLSTYQSTWSDISNKIQAMV